MSVNEIAFLYSARPADRPTWTPLFDGKTTTLLSERSRPYWNVEDGALVQAPPFKGRTMTDRLSSSRPAAVGQEPRRHPRFGPNRKVALSCTEGVLSVFGRGNRLHAPTLLDLSPTGLKLSTPEALQTGSVLRVAIATDGLPNDVETLGKSDGANRTARTRQISVPGLNSLALRLRRSRT